MKLHKKLKDFYYHFKNVKINFILKIRKIEKMLILFNKLKI